MASFVLSHFSDKKIIPGAITTHSSGWLAEECLDGKHEDKCVYLFFGSPGDRSSENGPSKCKCPLWAGCTCEYGQKELAKERQNG